MITSSKAVVYHCWLSNNKSGSRSSWERYIYISRAAYALSETSFSYKESGATRTPPPPPNKREHTWVAAFPTNESPLVFKNCETNRGEAIYYECSMTRWKLSKYLYWVKRPSIVRMLSLVVSLALQTFRMHSEDSQKMRNQQKKKSSIIITACIHFEKDQLGRVIKPKVDGNCLFVASFASSFVSRWLLESGSLLNVLC